MEGKLAEFNLGVGIGDIVDAKGEADSNYLRMRTTNYLGLLLLSIFVS